MPIEDPQGSRRAEGFAQTGPQQGCSKAQPVTVIGNNRGGGPMWRLSLLLHLLAPIVVAGLLWRGDNVEERRGPVVTDQDAELLRTNDPVNGGDRLRRLILQKLKVESPYVAVTIFDSEVQVIPASTPWTVHCGDSAGIAIAFTTNVTEPSGGLIVQLSDARPNKEQCLDIALSTAKLVEIVLAGRWR
jgi:hypothetical protein